MKVLPQELLPDNTETDDEFSYKILRRHFRVTEHTYTYDIEEITDNEL